MHIARPIRRPEDHPVLRRQQAGTVTALILFGLIGLGASLWVALHVGPLPCGVEGDPTFVCDTPP